MTFKRACNISIKVSLMAVFLISTILVTAYIFMKSREHLEIPTTSLGFGEYIKTDDAQIFVQQEGPKDGPTVVLIHGTGAWSEIWRETIDSLVSSGHRVIALDVPPFGYSEKLSGAKAYQTTKQAQRFYQVIQKLNIDQLTLVCHSVGCRPSIEMALTHPKIIHKMVLVDPALGFGPDQDQPQFVQNNPSNYIKALLAPTFLRDAIIAAYGSSPISIKPIFSSFVYDTSSVTDARVAMLKKPLITKGMTRAEGDWMQNLSIEKEEAGFTNYKNFKTLTMPTLLIWGEKDNITPLWQGKALEMLLPNAHLSVIKDTGHIPYIENESVFNKRLNNFLKTNP